jgi:exopolysaccharide biosynthesis protein
LAIDFLHSKKNRFENHFGNFLSIIAIQNKIGATLPLDRMQGKKFLLLLFCVLVGDILFAQLHWQNVDSLFQPLPNSVHIFYTDEKIDTGAFRAFYVIADLNDKKLKFTIDTTYKRRLTPYQFYQKNKNPLVVVNGTFFSFATNQNLDLVIRRGKILCYNIHSIPRRGKDTFTYSHPVGGAIGISKERKADVAWILTDSSQKKSYPSQWPVPLSTDSIRNRDFNEFRYWAMSETPGSYSPFLKPWKVKTAIGGGPVLISRGEINITNNEELKFAGKAIKDKHPRTAMGYTKNGQLIILVVQGRSESSGGATLVEEATILKDIGCVEALNLDGGGSSCLLVNGKETIKPSDKEGERAVPAVFLIKRK